jgi:dTDP-4-amino-4,6-dideoxygalactose transaminase
MSVEWRVPLSDLNYDHQEAAAVSAVLQSRWLTMGSQTQRFERAFAEYLGVAHAVAVSNATAGLHLANLALGVGVGDEVILPSLTFVATSNAVEYCGAKPVYAEITSERNFCISSSAIEAAITPRSKAICVVHYAGFPCDMVAIRGLARKHALALIEDAAHACGAELDGRKLGTWGDVAVFSFFSSKNVAVGEGGMVVSDNGALADRVKLLRSHGMTTGTWTRHQGEACSYDVVALGHNYRMDEIHAALGMVQLQKLEAGNQRRRQIAGYYRRHLQDVEGLSLPFLSHPGVTAQHLFPVLLDRYVHRKTFRDCLHAQGIQTSVHYPAIHQFQYQRGKYGDCSLPQTEEVSAREVTLPLFPTQTQEQVELVIKVVRQVMQERPWR